MERRLLRRAKGTLVGESGNQSKVTLEEQKFYVNGKRDDTHNVYKRGSDNKHKTETNITENDISSKFLRLLQLKQNSQQREY